MAKASKKSAKQAPRRPPKKVRLQAKKPAVSLAQAEAKLNAAYERARR